MALKSIEQIMKNIAEGSAVMPCIKCHEPKSIPTIRPIKQCDDCYEVEIKEKEKIDKALAHERKMVNQRIPERFRIFDVSKLECAEEFGDMCANGQSYAIFGESGTGKTNLACQILMQRSGLFYTCDEITTKVVERIQDESLLVLDDLTEVDSTDTKRVEALFKIFNHRYAECKDTIITLSKSYDEVERIFGDSGRNLVRRFRQTMTPIVLKTKW